MEIAGDLFKPFFGLVNQTTFAPVGRLIPWKMSKITLDLEVNEVETDHNAIPDFATAIGVKRKATGTVHNACFDPTFTFFGVNPFAAAAAFIIHEGMYIRALAVPNTSVAGGAGIGDIRGVPILGAPAELPAAVPAGSYIFLSLLVKKIHHEADAAAGQPFDFDFRSVWAYALPGESTANLTAYGWSPAVGAGGFL